MVLSGEAGNIRGVLCDSASLHENTAFTVPPTISDLVLRTKCIRPEHLIGFKKALIKLRLICIFRHEKTRQLIDVFKQPRIRLNPGGV